MKSTTYQKKEKTIEIKPKPVNIKNTPYLVIVESPSKCRKIEKILGFQYKCIASKGHICNISKIKKDCEPIFEILKEKKQHVEYMREIISQFAIENIYLGTDDDREGEAIAWHICRIFQLPTETTNRIIFHEITDSAIRAAVAFPLKIRMNIVNSQKARQVLDRIVGFEISPLLSKRISNNENMHLSAGRCQTPALRLIYDLEEKKNERKYSYQTIGYFFSPSIPCTLSHAFETEIECEDFLEKSKTYVHTYSLENPENKKMSAPLPFNTSTLLQYINNTLHLTPKQIMYYCQILYQNGFITYMRTESTKYSLEFLNKIRECFDDETWIGDLSKIQNHNHNNPHEAIRITNLEKCRLEEKDIDSVEEKKDFIKLNLVYDIIRIRTIESCMSDYQYKNIKIKIDAPNEYYYQYDLEIPMFLGWKKCKWLEKDFLEKQEKQNAFYFSLQHKSKKRIDPDKIECNIITENGKSYYTESGLIKKLEDLGIGRPSTFAMILETIQEKKYVLKKDIEGDKRKVVEFLLDNKKIIKRIEKERIFGQEKNKLIIQDLGRKVIEELIETFETLFSYDYTNKMEKKLDLVYTESLEWKEICKECELEIKENSKKWKEEIRENYKIDEFHELIFSKNGPMIKKRVKEEYEYKTIRKIKLDLEKLKRGEYTLEELLEIPNEYLGNYLDKEIYLKNGPYGAYIIWGDKKESIKELSNKKNLWDIQLQDIISILSIQKETKLPPNVLRVINNNMTIRKGKFGPYIYYTKEVKPECYSLKKFLSKGKNINTCDVKEIIEWIEETYGIM